MTQILVAPERFFPTMKAQAVAQAMARGLQRVSPQFEVLMYPLASGGSGTTDLAARAAKGRVHHESITLPNRHVREVKWGLLPDGTAIFDAKDALGNPDGPSQLQHTYTDSAPLALMIHRLIRHRPRRIAVALGDVLAVDGGMGLLQMFGVQPFDAGSQPLNSGLRQLLRLDYIDFSGLQPPSIPLLALTDQMTNWDMRVQQEDFRLDLIHGGLQTAAMRFVDSLAEHVALPLRELPGTGVGGGLGMALAFLGAQFQLGAEYLTALGTLRETVWNVDWVLTGSAELSRQSDYQTVGFVAGLARDAGVPAIALTIDMRPDCTHLYDSGLTGLYSILDRPRTAKEVHRMLPALIEKAAYRTGIWMQALSDPS